MDPSNLPLRARRVAFPYAEEIVELRVARICGPPEAAWVRAAAAALRRCAFPLKRHALTEADAERFFAALVAYPAAPWRRVAAIDPSRLGVPRATPLGFGRSAEGGMLVLRHARGEYEAIDRLGDMFQEEVRMRARRAGTATSPAAAWAGADPAFREAVVRVAVERWGRVDAYTLREAMWYLPRFAESTAFKPALALSILRALRSRRILDPCAGWGDRLLAALAHGAEAYVGVDPNRELERGHAAIVRKFGGGNTSVTMRYAPFEDVALEAGETFDTVFTSPPYFDTEEYARDASQSLARHPTLREWLRAWLAPCLAKAWARLDVGGHMAIHMCDRRIAGELLRAVGRLHGARYVGALFSVAAEGAARPRPTWVFAKEEAAE